GMDRRRHLRDLLGRDHHRRRDDGQQQQHGADQPGAGGLVVRLHGTPSSRRADAQGTAPRAVPCTVESPLSRCRHVLTAPCPSQKALSGSCVFAGKITGPTIGGRSHRRVTPVTGGGSRPSAPYRCPTSAGMMNQFTTLTKMARIRPTTPPMPCPL